MTLRLDYSFSLCLLASAVFSSFASAEAPPQRVREIVICKSPVKDAATGQTSGRAVRTLRIYETKEKGESGASLDGCRATYTKTNVEQTVGTSRQLQQCQSIVNGIQKNLEASNWSCRSKGPMAVMRSSAAEASETMVDARVPVQDGSVVR